jgi:ribosome-binding protein aMBF1 (putative translation factor)
VVARAEQREAFRRALRRARDHASLSQRAVARAVERTPGAVWQWEVGRSAPDPITVRKLEQLLDLERDSLGRLLGYPLMTAERAEMPTINDAVNADPRLGADERKMLLTFYDWLVRNRRTKG